MTVAVAVTPAEAREVAGGWIADAASALEHADAVAVAGLFLDHGYWRDILALTGDLRTFAGAAAIAAGLETTLQRRTVRDLRLEPGEPDTFERKAWGWTVEAFFRFETDIASCRGHLRLLRDEEEGSWKAWTFLTAMEDLIGHEEVAAERRPVTTKPHGNASAYTSGTLVPQHDDQQPPAVLVVGAGHAGLTVAARLRQLGVPTVVVERHERVGDNWRHRYQSLLLHNQIWGNHLPYLPFPSTWPVYLSKDELADWLEAYVGVLGLRVWTGTEVLSGTYVDAEQRWSVNLRRSDGSLEHLQPRHVVLATGVFGPARQVELPGRESFDGTILHATEYSGNLPVAGKRALVVGSGSSAHDVAQDLSERGAASVTMLQRSSTCVVSVEPGAARATSIYSEHGVPVDDADLINNAFPLPLLAELHKEMTKRIAEMDEELLSGLRQAGFALDFGEDDSGFLMKFHRYGGGYYINVGCSDLIVAGKIAIKHGTEVGRLAGTTVRLTDGSSLEADLVVVAAGYRNMSDTVRRLFGDTVADRVGPVWGLDPEGEVRAMWKRTGQPGFWVMGGSLQQCRPYSKYLALQIKASELGLL